MCRPSFHFCKAKLCSLYTDFNVKFPVEKASVMGIATLKLAKRSEVQQRQRRVGDSGRPAYTCALLISPGQVS